jgi:hypothetical protein
MRLDQFRALCQREWAQEPRGDVVALRLTSDSYTELAGDMAAAVMRPQFAVKADFAAGITLQNPVTRSLVKLTGDSVGVDLVDVQHAVPYAVLP